MAIYNYNTALLREPPKSVTHGLRASSEQNPNYDGVLAEHRAYTAVLRAAGVNPIILPALEGFPDSLFVEDPALVFPEGAILLRSGALSRLGETNAIAPTLKDHFDRVLSLPAAGTVDGGDILITPGNVMIGLSERTNLDGAKALQSLLMKLGRESKIVTTPDGVLHFKSDCSLLDEETILSTERLAKSGVFQGFDIITVPEGEEAAANGLRINDIVMLSDNHLRTLDILDRLNYNIIPVKTREISKIDAGLSCMSLRWEKIDR